MIKIKANGKCWWCHLIVIISWCVTEGSILEQSVANFLLAQALYLKSDPSQEPNRHQGNNFISDQLCNEVDIQIFIEYML